MPEFLRREGVCTLWISPIQEFTSCMLCGCPTRTPDPAWMDLVRILYPQDKNNISLSGLHTRYHESDLRLRSDRHIEWLDPEEDPWAIPDPVAHPYGTPPSRAMYVVHESCWQYAVLCFGDDMPSNEDLFDVFRELPPPKDPAYLNRADYQPCILPSTRKLHSFAKPYPSRAVTISSEANPSDHFRRLPLELRQTIALLLDTTDLLALLHVSRAMGAIFHDKFFWKHKLRGGAFLDHLMHAGAGAGRRGHSHGHDEEKEQEETDWRRLYHVGSRIINTSETTVRVWEVVAWMKEYLSAARKLKKLPLDFYGSALQYHHNGLARTGRRVERVRVPASLVKVGVCITPTEECELQLAHDTEENVTEITGLDFTDADGSTTTMSVSGSGSGCYWTVPAQSLAGKTGRNLRVLLYGGRGDSRNKCQLSNIAGTRVVWDTDNASFHGFRMYWNACGIHSMGVLHDERHPYLYPQVFGYDPGGCRPIHAELEEVVEVVATWEDHRLVDLGFRGRKKRVSFQSLRDCPLPNNIVNWGRYGWIMKRKDAWDRRQRLCV